MKLTAEIWYILSMQPKTILDGLRFCGCIQRLNSPASMLYVYDQFLSISVQDCLSFIQKTEKASIVLAVGYAVKNTIDSDVTGM